MNKRYFVDNTGRLIVVDEVERLLVGLDDIQVQRYNINFEKLEKIDLNEFDETIKFEDLLNFNIFKQNEELNKKQVEAWLNVSTII